MPDFYFRGTLAQFWKAIYAEYLRLTAVLGREPFVLIATELKLPLAKYEPKISEQIQIHFSNEVDRSPVVSVRADSVLDAELVSLVVDVYPQALEEKGESVYAILQEMKNAWLEKGWLINPAAYIAKIAQLVAIPQEPPKPKTGAELTAFFERHHQKKVAGQKSTLKQIAEETGFGYRYVRQLHSKFLKERKLAR